MTDNLPGSDNASPPPDGGSADLYRFIAENVSDVVIRHTAEGEYLYVSPSSLPVLGYRPEEMLGHFGQEYMHPDDLPRVRAHIQRCLAKGDTSVLQYRRRRKDGTYIWVETTGRLIRDQQGRLIEVLSILRDISDRRRAQEEVLAMKQELEKRITSQTGQLRRINRELLQEIEERKKTEEALRESEARFRAISEVTSNYCYAISVGPDHSLQLDWITEGFEVISGHPVAELKFPLDFDWAALLHPEDYPLGARRLHRLLSNCADVSEYRIRTRDGRIRWVRDYGQPVWDDRAGRVVRLYGATQDITARRQAEEALRVEKRALEQTNIALRELMDRMDQSKQEVSQSVQTNVEKIVLPILDAMEEELPRDQRRYTALLRQSLEEVASPHVSALGRQFASLTPAEIRVAEMIRRGLASKEIARLLHISPSTVGRHRNHVRQKLGLVDSKMNLATYLNAYSPDTDLAGPRRPDRPLAGN